jgi:hypothetical protein
MDSREPTISPPSSASISESLLLLAYLGISALLKLSPDNHQVINPIILLEMARLGLLEQTDNLLLIITTGLRDTGGFASCPPSVGEHTFIPTVEMISETYRNLVQQRESE